MFFNNKPTRSKRYKKINGRNTIEMNIKTTDHLFDGRDPAPFREKDLDEDAAKYIITSLRELPDDQPAQLKIYITQPRGVSENDSSIKEAIRKFFEYESDMKRLERRHIFKVAFRSLFIGLTFLFLSIYASSFIDPDKGLFLKYINEGIHILGWYSMFHPISYALYEWWPIRDDELLFERASELEMEILFRNEMIEIAKKEDSKEYLKKLANLAISYK
ncbi:MAG: hypothetical protein V4596_04215 [Bdellovibrionota bacterium]